MSDKGQAQVSERLARLRYERAMAAATGEFAMPRALRTARLTLDQPDERHLADYVRFWTDPASTRYMGGVRDPMGAWKSLAATCGSWLLYQFGHYAVADARGVYLGSVGLWFPDDFPEIEVGYALMPEARGHGYASEAVTAVAAEAVRRGVPSLVSTILPDNAASQGVAARAGALLDRTVMLRGEPTGLWRYPVPADQAFAPTVLEAAS